jgi:hypothetical protein
MKIPKVSDLPTIPHKSGPVRIGIVDRRKEFFFLLKNIHELFVRLPEVFEVLSY